MLYPFEFAFVVQKHRGENFNYGILKTLTLGVRRFGVTQSKKDCPNSPSTFLMGIAASAASA